MFHSHGGTLRATLEDNPPDEGEWVLELDGSYYRDGAANSHGEPLSAILDEASRKAAKRMGSTQESVWVGYEWVSGKVYCARVTMRDSHQVGAYQGTIVETLLNCIEERMQE